MISIKVKRKGLFSKKYLFNLSMECSCKAEAESIEVSLLQMLGQLKAFDFENGDASDEEDLVEEKETKIGFDNYIVGDDDGCEPFEEEYEEEYEGEEYEV